MPLQDKFKANKVTLKGPKRKGVFALKGQISRRGFYGEVFVQVLFSTGI